MTSRNRLSDEGTAREREARFRALLAATNDVIFRMAPDWSEMRSLDGRGFLTDTTGPDTAWLDRYILPDDQPRVSAAIAKAIGTRSAFEFEHRVIRADGSPGWARSRAVAILGEDGEILEWFGTASDVTARHAAEAKLRESERRFRSVFDSIDEGYCLAQMILDGDSTPVDYRFLEINPLFEEMTGLKDPLGKTALELVPDLEAFWIETYASVGLGRESLRFEQRSEAMGRDFDVYATPVEPHGCFVLVFRDITEKKRGQMARRASEERFRSFAENSADTLWIADAASGELEYLSPAYERIWGESRDRVMQDAGRWAELLHPDDVEEATEAMRQAASGTVHQQTYRIIRPSDGAERVIQDKGFPITDENGRITRIGGIAQDVTEQRRAEAALRKSQEQLQLALDAGKLGIWDWDILNDTVEWSENHFRLEGYAVGEVEPSYEAWLRRVHPGDREETDRKLRQAQADRRPYYHEFRTLLPDRSVRWLSAQGAFYYDDEGNAVRMVGVMHDVTDRKTDQEQLTLMVAELQHRTRNLIGVVSALARQIQRVTDTPDAFTQKFSDQLLALSRVQGLLSRSGRVPITIGAVVQQELEAMGIADAQDRLHTGGPDVLLRRSKVQILALCLHELATNARKYGAFDSDRGRLSVTWDFADGGDGDRLRLDWIETGVELDEAARSAPRNGYGRELIEKALPYAVGAETHFDLQPDGLKCSISLPLQSQGKRKVAG